MLKIPYLFEGISNIFKPILTECDLTQADRICKGYRGKVIINDKLCTNCGECINLCPTKAISREINMENGVENIKYSIDIYACIYCGLCEELCESKAISSSEEVFIK